MKKALPILAALCAIILMMYGGPHAKADASGEGLKLSDPLEGIWKPADDPQASFQYRLPQFEPDTAVAEAINRYYADLAQLGIKAAADYEISINTNRYLGVILHLSESTGAGNSETFHADSFALDGIYQGRKISLSQLLGMEQDTSDSVASELAWKLVWQIVSREMENSDGDYLDGLTEERIRAAFDPETDFLLDTDGNIVFLIQPGEIAGEIAGVLMYPFSIAELLDAM